MVSNERKKKVYWGILFYSGWKFWLAIIISLLANIFFLLYCWHCLWYFTSLTFKFRLCIILLSSAPGCCRNWVSASFWLVILCHLEHVSFFMSLIVWFFIKKKDNLQFNHTKHKLWVSPEEGWGDQHRAGAPLLHRQAERLGVVQSGEKMVLSKPYAIFQYLKGV